MNAPEAVVCTVPPGGQFDLRASAFIDHTRVHNSALHFELLLLLVEIAPREAFVAVRFEELFRIIRELVMEHHMEPHNHM